MSEHDEQVEFFVWVKANELYNKDPDIKKAMALCWSIPNGGKRPKKLTSYGKKMVSKYGSNPPKIIGKQGWFYSPGAQSLVSEGLKGGVPDIEMNRASGLYHGLKIEMKYRKGGLSDSLMVKHRMGEYLVDLDTEQKTKRELLIEADYKYVICYTAAEAKEAVINYLPYDKNDYIEV